MARKEIPGATLSLISISLSELRKDFALLTDAGWPEPVRRRAHGLACALRDACGRQGLKAVADLAGSLAGLARLSRAEAAPLRAALREKVGELLDLAARLVTRLSSRHTG